MPMVSASPVELPHDRSCVEPSRSKGAIPAILAADLDDRTIAYAIAMQAPFEHLRQAAAQLAGILVLAAVGSHTATPHHPMLALARQTQDEATDAIRAARVPPRGKHHYEHLARAASWIGRALARAQGSPGIASLDVEATLLLLRRGWRQLQSAAGALPGFEIVAFEQSCCALHAHPNASDTSGSTARIMLGRNTHG